MESLVCDVNSFLNDLNLSSLLVDPEILTKVKNIDVNIIILYGNNPVILQKCFYKMYDIGNNIRETTLSIDDCELEYVFSDKHIELKMTDKGMKHMKQVVKNNNISNKKFLFLIKDCNISNHNTQFGIKRIIEKYTNATYVFIVKSLSCILPSIQNMGCNINCKFPFHNVASYLFKDYEGDLDKWKGIYEFHENDILNLMLLKTHNIEKTKIEESFITFFEKTKKEKNCYEITSLCREFSYKLFHINIPMTMVTKHILKCFEKHEKRKLLPEIIFVLAKCDHLASLSKKNILVFEKTLLEVVHLMKK
jgi:hypothetical protein